MIKRISVLIGALALCACAALSTATTVGSALLGGPTPPAIQAVGQTVVLDGSKALAIAHLTYESVGAAALAGRRTKVNGHPLIGDAAWAQVQAYDNTIYGYLSKGDAAKDSASKAAYASSALKAIDALKSLVPSSLFKK
jgi:hypothetical protein